MGSPRQIQIVISAGAEDPHKARQGLEAALAARSMDIETTVFLSLRGAFWAEAREHSDCVVPGCESIPSLVRDLVDSGAQMECCSSCAMHFAGVAGSCDMDKTLIEGVQLSGLTAMVARLAEGVPTVTY